jgi:hypothetical protein
MKKLMNFVAVLTCISVVLFTACKKEEENSKEIGSIKFSLSKDGRVLLKSAAACTDSSVWGDTSRISAMMVTIVNSVGQVVCDSKVIQVYSFGGGYISESISLESGNYKLTKFTVVAGSKVAYVAPIKGSERAQLVNYPLPLDFSIQPNYQNTVFPEVLAVENFKPSSFGYTNFSFDVVSTQSFKIKVMDGLDSIPMSAFLEIGVNDSISVNPQDTAHYGWWKKILTYNLKAGENNVEVINAQYYYMRVSKPGYREFKWNFTWNDLHTEYGAVLITLSKADSLINVSGKPKTH